MPKKNRDISIDKSTFFKFRKLYLSAFLLIAFTIVISQILIQNHLNSQLNDSQIVNIAGRQRMLSQKLVKEALYLVQFNTKEERLKGITTLKGDNAAFLNSHKKLQDEYSELGTIIHDNSEFKSLFSQIEKYQNDLVKTCDTIAFLVKQNPLVEPNELRQYLVILRNAENHFLEKMDEIVFKYDALSQHKVQELKRKEYILSGIILLILILEILLFFKPISVQIKKTMAGLINSKQEALEKATKVEALYVATEVSLQELKGLNYAINNVALFASVARDGSVVHISKKFSKLLGIEKQDIQEGLAELLMLEEGEQQTIKELLKGKRRSIWVGEIQVTTKSDEKLWLEMSIIPMNKIKSDQRVLILCTDITKRKISQKEIDALNEERFEEQVNLQKIQASQIVEAQEEERKRIAKDIHDGIGQMLTAIKFNIESINASGNPSISNKVTVLKDLLGNLIKEVRTVTFNLTPPELVDYGIVPTISKLANQLSNLTGKKVYFENKTGFNGRFDSLVETNLYRVVQEAVNNSLKYAESNYILITMNHSEQLLSIVIDDDGKGFDIEELLKTRKDAGMGLFFMKERINYINGRLFINSSKNDGTRITININLPNS